MSLISLSLSLSLSLYEKHVMSLTLLLVALLLLSIRVLLLVFFFLLIAFRRGLFRLLRSSGRFLSRSRSVRLVCLEKRGGREGNEEGKGEIQRNTHACTHEQKPMRDTQTHMFACTRVSVRVRAPSTPQWRWRRWRSSSLA